MSTLYVQVDQTLYSHPKVIRIARQLGVSVQVAAGHLIALRVMALDLAQDGNLSRFDAADIAVAAGWDADADQFVSVLRDIGWLDESMTIHDWAERESQIFEARRKDRDRKASERVRRNPAENSGFRRNTQNSDSISERDYSDSPGGLGGESLSSDAAAARRPSESVSLGSSSYRVASTTDAGMSGSDAVQRFIGVVQRGRRIPLSSATIAEIRRRSRNIDLDAVTAKADAWRRGHPAVLPKDAQVLDWWLPDSAQEPASNDPKRCANCDKQAPAGWRESDEDWMLRYEQDDEGMATDEQGNKCALTLFCSVTCRDEWRIFNSPVPEPDLEDLPF